MSLFDTNKKQGGCGALILNIVVVIGNKLSAKLKKGHNIVVHPIFKTSGIPTLRGLWRRL